VAFIIGLFLGGPGVETTTEILLLPFVPLALLAELGAHDLGLFATLALGGIGAATDLSATSGTHAPGASATDRDRQRDLPPLPDFGGVGGGGGFILLTTLLAILGLLLLTTPSVARRLGVLAVSWRPSGFASPIEQPG
jgi:hypothetical protein